MGSRLSCWLVLFMLLEIRALPQESVAPKTVLDGVYTEAQAKRGEEAYNANCAGCHGEDLNGRVMGPLRGQGFLDLWREDGLAFLFTHIKTRMPANAAGSLSEKMYLDILAYILQVNKLPSGPQELTAESVAHNRMVGPDGPQPLSTNTIVRVVGCMTGSGDSWAIERATEPVRTHDAERSTPDELKSAALEVPGSETFRLQNLDDLPPPFDPRTLSGQKVQAKGVLIRQPGRDRINVMSIHAVSSSCAR